MCFRFLKRDFPDLDATRIVIGSRRRLSTALHRALYAGILVYVGLSMGLLLMWQERQGEPVLVRQTNVPGVE